MFCPPPASEEKHSSRASTETIRHQYWVPARSRYPSTIAIPAIPAATAAATAAAAAAAAATAAAITAATATITAATTTNTNDANEISYFQNLFYRPKSTEDGGVGAGVASSTPSLSPTSPSSQESTSQNWRESVPFQVMLHRLQIPDGLTVGDLIDIHQEVLRILSDIQNELQAFRQTA
jgi:hypothetical protein